LPGLSSGVWWAQIGSRFIVSAQVTFASTWDQLPDLMSQLKRMLLDADDGVCKVRVPVICSALFGGNSVVFQSSSSF
jgi:hypothetical protein